jgi:AcrR family transcriptional regulator
MSNIGDKVKIPKAKEHDSERSILEAAKHVFVQKGMDGATLQDIADTAQISRTALHYYFRSKEKLFEAVLDDIFAQFLPRLNHIMEQKIPFEEKLEQFVDEYLTLLKSNPFIPNFMMNELTKNPERIIRRFAEEGLMSAHTIGRIERELKAFEPLIPMPHFVMNLIGLCVFPFIAKPLITEIFADGEPAMFNQLMTDRKRIIVETLLNSIGRHGQ